MIPAGVKICGLTNLTDARAALAAGADYLGFIFATESKRRVSPRVVEKITAQLPAATPTVGVFVDSPAVEINRIVSLCRLRFVQLHGDEEPAIIGKLRNLDGIWKTVWPRDDTDFAKVAEFPADALVVDTAIAGFRGGTGVVGNWSLAARLAGRVPVVLAGGLSPDNVEQAIRQVRPFAVDVAGGVEIRPGRKDREKMRLFCAAAKKLTGS